MDPLVVMDFSRVNFDDDDAVVGEEGGGGENGEKVEDARGGGTSYAPTDTLLRAN